MSTGVISLKTIVDEVTSCEVLQLRKCVFTSHVQPMTGSEAKKQVFGISFYFLTLGTPSIPHMSVEFFESQGIGGQRSPLDSLPLHAEYLYVLLVPQAQLLSCTPSPPRQINSSLPLQSSHSPQLDCLSHGFKVTQVRHSLYQYE